MENIKTVIIIALIASWVGVLTDIALAFIAGRWPDWYAAHIAADDPYDTRKE